jgi:hypothetical protein
MKLAMMNFFAKRYKPALRHFLVCLFIASGVFSITRFVWYPDEFWYFSGGQTLFLMIVVIDVILGPSLTFVVSSPNKQTKVLLKDIACIACVQMIALIYGVYAVYVARPVFMVFAVDRFNVVNYSDLDSKDLSLAENKEFSSRSLFGPVLVATRRADPGQELLKMVEDAVSGKDVELQPKFYQPYKEACASVQERLKPLEMLNRSNPDSKDAVAQIVANYGTPSTEYGYLPVVARSDWIAVLRRSDCQIVHYYKLIGF